MINARNTVWLSNLSKVYSVHSETLPLRLLRRLSRRRFGKIIAQHFSDSERVDTIKSRGNVSMSIRAHLNLVTHICVHLDLVSDI